MVNFGLPEEWPHIELDFKISFDDLSEAINNYTSKQVITNTRTLYYKKMKP